ncbi:MAG: TIGR03067 domain-containing protein [Pirellulaceae bacterium]|nr:TIGR03067 domain-containing protein [Pirellulaceae bacterium]
MKACSLAACLLTLALAANGTLFAGDREELIGEWRIVEFQDDGGDKIGRLGGVSARGKRAEKFAKLIITSDEIYVLRGDGQRDVLTGLTNCAWKSFTIDSTTNPKQIDIVGVPGKDDKPHHYHGIYSLEKEKLSICWNETPRSPDPAKARPTKFASDDEMNLFVCERLPSAATKPTP